MCRQREGYRYLCVDTYRIPYFWNILFSEIISEKPTQLKWYKLINAIFNLNNGLVRKKKLLSALSCWKCRLFPSPTVPGLAIIWIITSLDSNVHANVIKKKKDKGGVMCVLFLKQVQLAELLDARAWASTERVKKVRLLLLMQWI